MRLRLQAFNRTLLVLWSEARIANRTEIGFEDPIRDTKTLSSRDGVRVAVVDTDVHARVDDLLLRLREAGEGARLLLASGLVVVI